MGLYQNVLESADGGVFVNTRDAAGTGITSTLVSGKQGLDVNVINSIMVGIADETAFTYGTSSYQPIGGVYNSSITALTSGQGGVFSVTAQRDLRVNLRNAAGTELGAANANGVFVQPGDGTNVQAYSATSEAFAQIRQGGNVANVTAANELKTLDSNAGSILGLMQMGSAALTPVTGSNVSAVALASNALRKGFSVVNATSKILYLAMTATASPTAFTVALQPNAFYEQIGDRVYTGDIAQISPTGVSGDAMWTEY